MTSSANNSTNTLLNGGATWVGLWESPADTIQGVQILINTNVAGTAYIQFSQDRSRVEYEHAYGVIGGIALYKIERRKAKYVRVKYINDASAQTLMLLHTTYLTDYEKEDIPITIDAEDSNILIFGELPTGGLQAVKLDASGNLLVAGISGGGVSSDVNITNTLLQVKDISAIEQMTIETDRILYDTDIIANRLHDISGSVYITNNELATRDASAVALLETLNEAVGNIELNTSILGVQPVHLSLSVNGADVWADGYDWVVPETGEDGWAYINEYGTTGTQLYYYANAPALRPLSVEPNISLGSVECGWFIGNQKLLTDPDNRFIMNIYTQPLGDGNDYAFWYRSRRAYWVSSSVVLSKAVDYFFYWGTDPTLLHPEYKHIELSLAVSEGLLLPEEVVEFMSVNVPTIPPINEFYGVVKQAGFVGANTIRNVYFNNDVSFKAETQLGKLDISGTELLVRDASAIALLAEIANGITVEVGQVDISGVSVVNAKLSVLDASANLELITIREILADTINTITFGLLDDTPTYLPIRVDASGAMLVHTNNPQTIIEISGVVLTDLSGGSFTDAKLNVFDSSSNEHLTAIEDILETGFINVVDASANAVLDLLTFVDNDISNNLLVLDLTNNAILSQLSFYTDDDTSTILRVKQVGSVDVRNPEGQTLSVSGNVGLIAEQTVGIEGSVQTHNFASSNGTDWHHLHSDANGNIITLSRTHDGAGNDISSTTATGGIRGLDVNLINSSVAVSNTNANALYGRPRDISNAQVATNASINGPMRIGSSDADTEGYTYISAIMSFTAVSGSGNVYLEVSHDANLFARPSGASTFIMTSVANVSASILLSSPVPFRYARLWADTGLIGANCNAWIVMK
jgi:hypothetical protein